MDDHGFRCLGQSTRSTVPDRSMPFVTAASIAFDGAALLGVTCDHVVARLMNRGGEPADLEEKCLIVLCDADRFPAGL